MKHFTFHLYWAPVLYLWAPALYLSLFRADLEHAGENVVTCTVLWRESFMLRIHFHPVLLCSPRFGSTFSLSTDTPAHLLLAGMMLDILPEVFNLDFYSSKPLLHTSAFLRVEFLVCLVGSKRSTEVSFSYVNQSIFWSNLVQIQSLSGEHTNTDIHTQTHRFALLFEGP